MTTRHLITSDNSHICRTKATSIFQPLQPCKATGAAQKTSDSWMKQVNKISCLEARRTEASLIRQLERTSIGEMRVDQATLTTLSLRQSLVKSHDKSMRQEKISTGVKSRILAECSSKTLRFRIDQQASAHTSQLHQHSVETLIAISCAKKA